MWRRGSVPRHFVGVSCTPWLLAGSGVRRIRGGSPVVDSLVELAGVCATSHAGELVLAGGGVGGAARGADSGGGGERAGGVQRAGVWLGQQNQWPPETCKVVIHV